MNDWHHIVIVAYQACAWLFLLAVVFAALRGRWRVYLLMALVLWLCGRIANGQPPGRRLPTCTDAAAVDAAVTSAVKAMRSNAEAWESLRDELRRLLNMERATTKLMGRVYDEWQGHR